MSARLTVTDISPPVPIQGLSLPPLHKKMLASGDCMFREVGITLNIENAFRAVWMKNKRAFYARGFMVRQTNGKWMLSQWLEIAGSSLTLTKIGQERFDGLTVSAVGNLPLTFAAPTLDLPTLPFGLADKLRGYQVEPTRQIYRALMLGPKEWGCSGAADLSDMGVGKTYMDLAAAIASGKDIGVLCPTVGAAGWRRACDHFGIEPLFISTYEAVRGAFRPHIARIDAATGAFTWANPDNLVLILDEAQALRHDDTLTVKCCSAAVRQCVSIIVASATIATSPLEFRFAGRVTGLHKGFDDWDRFLSDHGCLKQGQTWKWDQKDHHLARINGRLFPSRGARVRKQDLGEECPETVIEAMPFKIPEGDRIEQEWKETEAMLARMGAQMSPAKIRIIESRARMKMWQRCEGVLVPYIAERIRKDVADGKSVAVFMNFNESRLNLARLLNTNAGFYGGQPLARRQYFEREFQADRLHVLINNIGAGGASVSLHDVRGERSRIAYIFPTDHVIQMEQATGRVDRVGGKSVSLQFIPYVAGSMTEKMIHRTRQKMRRIATINDGHNASAVKF